jgi:glycosyltransferase involved in cell wall biosynthesis
MKNADVYVQPSLSEAFCTTVVEAKVLSKPIVSTDVDSVFEQLEHGKNALICGYCGSELVLRKGRFGEFYGCSQYPKCKYTKN